MSTRRTSGRWPAGPCRRRRRGRRWRTPRRTPPGWPLGRRQAALPGVVHERGVRVARVERVRLAVAAEPHLVRLFLMPFERALRAVDFDPQIVLAAVADLRGGDRAQRAVLEADDRRAVVVELAARLEHLRAGS